MEREQIPLSTPGGLTDANSSRRAPLVYAAAADGRLVYVDHVPRGLACDGRCPKCGERLIARQGIQKVHSFAHESGTECATAPETALHRIAKQLLAEGLQLVLPEWRVVQGFREQVVWKSATHSFDTASLETRVGDVVPDVVLMKDDRRLLVEIHVTHECDEAKIAKLRSSGDSAIEIRLSHLPYDAPPDVVRDAVLSTAPRKWLANSKLQVKEDEIRGNWRDDDVRAHEKAEERARHVSNQAREKRRQKVESRVRAILQSLSHNPTQKEHDSRRVRLAIARVRAADLWGHAGIGIQGDYCFTGDRQVWQARLLDWLVVRADERRAPQFSMQFAVGYAELTGLLVTGVPGFVKDEVEALVRLQRPDFWAPYKVLGTYFDELVLRGVLGAGRQHWYPLPFNKLSIPRRAA